LVYIRFESTNVGHDTSTEAAGNTAHNARATGLATAAVREAAQTAMIDHAGGRKRC
jgi:hypothetical protein